MAQQSAFQELLAQVQTDSRTAQKQTKVREEIPTFPRVFARVEQPAIEQRSFTEKSGDLAIDIFKDLTAPLGRMLQSLKFATANPRVFLPGAVNDPDFVKAVGELDDQQFDDTVGGLIDLGIISTSIVLTPFAGKALGVGASRLGAGRIGQRIASKVGREAGIGGTFGALAPDRNDAGSLSGRVKEFGIGVAFGGVLGGITGRASGLRKLANQTERQTLLELASKSVDDVAELLIPEHGGTLNKTARDMLARLSNKELVTLFQAEAVNATGTLQGKTTRELFGKAFSQTINPENLAVNAETINAVRAQFIAQASNFRGILKKVALEAADPAQRAQALKAVGTLKQSINLFLQSRKVAGQSLKAFQKSGKSSISLFEDAAKSVTTATQEAAAIGMVKGGRATIMREFVDEYAKNGFSNALASQGLRGSLQLWRRGIFPMFSLMRDGLTNSFALASEGGQDLAEDMFRFAVGKSFRFDKTSSTIKALGNVKDIFRNRAGSQIEKIVIPTALGEKFQPFFGPILDKLAFIPLNLKAYVDTSARRLAAMSSLYDDGAQIARRFKLRGAERKEFIQNFVFKDANDTLINKAFQQAERQVGKAGRVTTINPKLSTQLEKAGTAATVRAQEKAGRVGFTRELSNFEETIANNAAVQLLVTPFPRWNFQFTRFMIEHSPASSTFWKKVSAGSVTGEEITRFTTRMLSGAGGLMAVDQMIYDNVDFESMQYVDPDDGGRVSLLGATPLPELLFIAAMFRGDADRAFAALKESSVVFGPLLEQNGIFEGVAAGLESLGRGQDATVAARNFTKQMGQAMIAGIPGSGVLKMFERIVDPIHRTGILRDIPGLSTLESPIIDVTTGEERRQILAKGGSLLGIPVTSIEESFGLTTGAGEPLDLGIPFLAQPPNLLENAMRNNAINPFGVGRGTNLLEAEAKDIPEALRNEFRETFGRLWAQVGSQLISMPAWEEMGTGSHLQRETMLSVMRNLLDEAKQQLLLDPTHRKIYTDNVKKHYDRLYGDNAESINPLGPPVNNPRRK